MWQRATLVPWAVHLSICTKHITQKYNVWRIKLIYCVSSAAILATCKHDLLHKLITFGISIGFHHHLQVWHATQVLVYLTRVRVRVSPNPNPNPNPTQVLAYLRRSWLELFVSPSVPKIQFNYDVWRIKLIYCVSSAAILATCKHDLLHKLITFGISVSFHHHLQVWHATQVLAYLTRVRVRVSPNPNPNPNSTQVLAYLS